MKRYLLFGGPAYYPSGGAKDVIATGGDRAELRLLAQGNWWHILDLETGLVIEDEEGNKSVPIEDPEALLNWRLDYELR